MGRNENMMLDLGLGLSMKTSNALASEKHQFLGILCNNDNDMGDPRVLLENRWKYSICAFSMSGICSYM